MINPLMRHGAMATHVSRSRAMRFHGGRRGSNPVEAAEIECMFWCMFASNVTAIYCDIMQNRNGAQVFYSL